MYILMPTLIGLLGGLAGMTEGYRRTVFVLAAAFFSLALTFWLAYEGRSTALAHESAARARGALASSLSSAGRPLVAVLGNAIDAQDGGEFESSIQVLINRTLAIAQNQVGRMTGRSATRRSVLYLFETDSKLTRVAHEGRIDRVPRIDFNASRGDADRRVIDLARGEDVLLVNDVEQATPRYFSDYEGRPYRSFITIPVRTSRKSFGLLSVDSSEPDAFTEADVGFMALLAGMLAAGLALRERNTETQSGPTAELGSTSPALRKPGT
ncbi:GAF domain-containing protein [Micromonospora chalcea]|uniref:GAF domain-containing protein n=1 Tax=Micromonospora chalcea TaxID=1874 RepID=UPI003410185C